MKFPSIQAAAPFHTYATPEIQASPEYQAALAHETALAADFPGLFFGPTSSRPDRMSRFETAIALWEAARFMGWADNYRAALAQGCPGGGPR